MVDLLGFPNGPNIFTMPQEYAFLARELDYFWSRISRETPTEPNSRNSTQIHSPVIRYFHMILAYTLFGKLESSAIVPRDELFIMFCVFQSRPVNVATFMLANLIGFPMLLMVPS